MGAMMQSCTFAAFADPHYAQRDPHIGRFYRQSPEKLRQCLPAFSAPDVDFVVCLGDLVDGTRADAEEMAALAKEADKPVCYALATMTWRRSREKRCKASAAGRIQTDIMRLR